MRESTAHRVPEGHIALSYRKCVGADEQEQDSNV